MLGVARYRLGLWESSAQTLEQAKERRPHENSLDMFFLAMARLKLGEREQAREVYTLAVKTMQENRPGKIELIQLAEEAASVWELDDGSNAVDRESDGKM